MVNVAFIKIWNELVGVVAYDATTGIYSIEFETIFFKIQKIDLKLFLYQSSHKHRIGF